MYYDDQRILMLQLSLLKTNLEALKSIIWICTTFRSENIIFTMLNEMFEFNITNDVTAKTKYFLRI